MVLDQAAMIQGWHVPPQAAMDSGSVCHGRDEDAMDPAMDPGWHVPPQYENTSSAPHIYMEIHHLLQPTSTSESCSRIWRSESYGLVL